MTDTTEQPTSEAVDRAELLRHTHRATHDALQVFAAGLKGLTPDEIARLLIAASTTTVAATLGPEYTAALLYSIADQLAAPSGATVN
jgi:hypothetical protein